MNKMSLMSSKSLTDSGALMNTLLFPICHWSDSILTAFIRCSTPLRTSPLHLGHVSFVRIAYLKSRSSIQSRKAFRPILYKQKYLMDYNYTHSVYIYYLSMLSLYSFNLQLFRWVPEFQCFVLSLCLFATNFPGICNYTLTCQEISERVFCRQILPF